MRASFQTLAALSLVAATIGLGLPNSAALAYTDASRVLHFTPIARGHGIGLVFAHFCRPPAVREHECVAWGKGAPGTLFGPCTAYSWVCQTPPILH